MSWHVLLQAEQPVQQSGWWVAEQGCGVDQHGEAGRSDWPPVHGAHRRGESESLLWCSSHSWRCCCCFQRDGLRCFVALTAVCIFPSALCCGAVAALTQRHRLTQLMSEFTFVDAVPSSEEQQASFLRREKCTQLSVLSRVVFKCFGWHICDVYKSPSKLLLPSHSNHGLITVTAVVSVLWQQSVSSVVVVFSLLLQTSQIFVSLGFHLQFHWLHTKVFVWKPGRKAAMFRNSYRDAETKFTGVSVLETEKGHSCIESYDGWHVYLFVSVFDVCVCVLPVKLLFSGGVGGDLFR